MSRRTRSVVAAVTLGVALGLAGCSQAINPTAIADAQLSARVKTVLINDALIGLREVEVRVAAAIVYLSGRVATDEEVTRAIVLARSVDGVTKVVADLSIGGADADTRLEDDPDADSDNGAGATGPSGRAALGFEDDEPERNLLAVGASIGVSHPRIDGADSVVGVGPLLRFGRGSGLGLNLGLGWFNTDFTSVGVSGRVGSLRLHPLMAGVGYTLGRDRVRTSLSLVGGIAFNSLADQDRSPGPVWALSVRDSFAWRPGVSVWIDLGPRVAFNTFAGYLVTRPRVTLLEDGRVRSVELRADAAILRAGLAYRLF